MADEPKWRADLRSEMEFFDNEEKMPVLVTDVWNLLDGLAERDRLQAEVERLRGALRDTRAECNRCLNVQGVPAAETPTTHGYGKILDIAARSLLASGDAR